MVLRPGVWVQELAAFERYGDKGKLAALQGDVDFGMFAEAFKTTPTVRT